MGGRARPARAQAGRVRARERPAGSGGPVCARSLAVGRPLGRRLSVCGWGAQQPGGGAPLCLRQSESGASAGARRRTHSRAARRARRAPDLEPVQGRCGLGSSSARVVCTCGATRLRIEWSEERWGVVSSVRTFRTGTCRSTVSTASAPPRPAQPPAPHRGAPPLQSSPHRHLRPPAPPPAPPRVTSAPSPPLSPLLRHRHRLHDRRCLLPTATVAPSTLAAAALAPRLHHTLLARAAAALAPAALTAVH